MTRIEIYRPMINQTDFKGPNGSKREHVCGGFGDGDSYTYAFMDIVPEEDRNDSIFDQEGYIKIRDVTKIIFDQGVQP